MIYMIGGAPRTGKSILGQQVAARLRIGWISTDLLLAQLRLHGVSEAEVGWDASPEAISRRTEWFFPSLEHFVWGVDSHANNYLIEGVDFLPEHVDRLAAQFDIRAVFLGRSQMTLVQFDQYPGHSHGYARLPEEMRRQFAGDVPRWSKFIKREAARFGIPYVDMTVEFPLRLQTAESLLVTGSSH